MSTIILPGGRSLGFTVAGDLRGLPVIAFHATPGTSDVWRPADPIAAALGIRLVTPDRPGHGRSPAAGDGLDWPADLGVLADALGLDGFGLLGLGDGADLAAACAHALADRVTALALLDFPHIHCLPEILGWFQQRRRP